MLSAIRQLLGRKDAAPPAVPSGERVYAIGDVHGRLDLLEALRTAIEVDDAARGTADTTVILLGDLIDRGPASAQVIASVRQWSEQRPLRLICGNHEEMLLRSRKSLDALRGFLLYGGFETIVSYGIDPSALRAADLFEAQAMLNATLPQADIDLLRAAEMFAEVGDYLFVHAGVRPGVPLADQAPQDMCWIREPFLSHTGGHGHVVVHGHTIVDAPHLGHNRIGIDTGAYRSGRLTALGLEGERRWLIATEQADDGTITIGTRPV